LRTSRLTWVFGEPGTDKSALLRSGVLPLLQRRRGDRGVPPAGALEPPKAAPERRRCQPRPKSEVAIYFRDWAQAPLSALKCRIADAAPGCETRGRTLAELLQELHRQRGLGFVFLLDRFEDYLALAPDEAEVGQFADELIEAIAS
ncbi:MAG: hypothetical protein MUF16_18495, partial [Burkholderiaceae bacterium]|nr:hypothetical protein [Burkholderiaceae bacterium]